MLSPSAGTWVEAAGGDLVRADAIVVLRCADGQVNAVLASGQSLTMAGAGCPPGFHRQLLAEIALSRLLDGDRHTVVIVASARDQHAWKWAATRLSCTSHDDQSTRPYAPLAVPGK